MSGAKDPELKLFELYLAIAGKVSDRRAQANAWMLGVNGAVVGLYVRLPAGRKGGGGRPRPEGGVALGHPAPLSLPT